MSSDDPLAHTATAPASPRTIREPARTLGRYRLGRELGRGGMGVVYEAHDPELDRNIAIKVLRAAPSEDARARLLREARTLAKLSHANVIVVFDVGSDGHDDYVAMELVDGSTLGDWLAKRPPVRDVLAAFVAAGRGLAAAHAAGIVHRDFKPHNVLRRGDGRVVVTDFGIAHAIGAVVDTPTGADAAIDRTATGTLVGTPSYMAPEQWQSGAITPATDQFAFCVALWEALAGERPFRGATIDELRAAVLAGPDALDVAKLPRALRGPIRRGLALDPAKRWPSVDALVDRIDAPTRHARNILRATATAVIAASAAAVVATRGASRSSCPPPALAPEAVASAPNALAIAGELNRWREIRGRACDAEPPVQAARLACLDGAIARLDDIARATGPTSPDAIANELVEPATCESHSPPHLTSPIDRELAAAFASLRAAAVAPSPIARDEPAPASPCARAAATLARTLHRSPTSSVLVDPDADPERALVDRCADEALRAELAVHPADATDPPSLRRAEAASDAFPGEHVATTLDELRGDVASASGRVDEAIAHYERAIAAHGRAGRARARLGAVHAIAVARMARGTSEDLAAVVALAERWRTDAAAVPDRARKLAGDAAIARWRAGDVAGGDAAMPAGEATFDGQVFASFVVWPELAGTVVDEADRPVAGAEVSAASLAVGDAAHPISPAVETPATAITDAAGRFTLHRARGMVVAQAGTARSRPAELSPDVRLVVHPTSRIEGTVALHGTPAGRVWVVGMPVGDDATIVGGPVRADGTFVLDRVPRGKLRVTAREVSTPPTKTERASTAFEREVDASAPIAGVGLEIRGPVVVIASSRDATPPERAVVIAMRGRHDAANATYFSALTVAKTPPLTMRAALPVGARRDIAAAPEDLVAELVALPIGELTVCAAGLSNRLMADTNAWGKANLLFNAALTCKVVEPEAQTVHLELRPVLRPQP